MMHSETNILMNVTTTQHIYGAAIDTGWVIVTITALFVLTYIAAHVYAHYVKG